MITEQRREQLLAGFDVAASSCGDKPIWSDVRKAPAWVQQRVAEIRAARAENKPDPPPTREWIAGAEKRYREARHKVALRHLAAHTARPVVAAQLTAAQVIAIAKRTGQSLEDVRFGKSPKVNEDAWLRERAANYGELILKDAKRFDDDDSAFDDDDDDDWDWDDDDSEKKHRRCAEAHRTLAQKAPDVFASIPQSRAASLHDVAATKRDRESHFAAQSATRALRKKK